MPNARNVEEYIAASPPAAHDLLNDLRKLLLTAVPGAQESISWGVPFYKYHGQLAGFAVYKNHISFGIATGVLEDKDRASLEKKGYKTGSKTLQIGFNQKVPAAEIKRILKAKAGINKEQKAKK